MAIAAFGRDTFIRVLKAASAATADASSSAGMGGGRASVVRTGNCSEEGRGFPKKPDWPSSCRWAVNQFGQYDFQKDAEQFAFPNNRLST